MNSVTMASVKNEDESDASMRQRLVSSLSQSFPGSALSKALQCMSESDDEMKDPLSSSCFAELRLEKADMEEDDELTSLAWLQDSDLLKNIHPGEVESADSQKENGDIRKLPNNLPQSHPSHVPYNPQKHINSKPPYSFSCLIFMAVEDSPQKRLPVKDIYNWILTHFPYFQNAPTGWKNSVRHNLSLNKCFKKVDKDKGQTIGKGSLWCIDPDYRPNLLQALRKTPYHPYHQLQMLASPQSAAQNPNLPFSRPLPLSPRYAVNQISPHLFPFLSKRLAQSSLDSDIDVANALVSLKGLNSSNSRHQLIGRGGMWRTGMKRKQMTQLSHHVKRKNLGPIICTLNPSEDHTYSVTASPSDSSSGRVSPYSSEEEYDFGSDDDIDEDSDYDGWASDYDEVDGDDNDDSFSTKGHKAQKSPRKNKAAKRDDEDEDMKIAEGANALLNLAGIKTSILPLRSISPLVNSSPQQDKDDAASS
ncbi:forkhead box protein N3-like isoform X2 [Liolophura sinensis]